MFLSPHLAECWALMFQDYETMDGAGKYRTVGENAPETFPSPGTIEMMQNMAVRT